MQIPEPPPISVVAMMRRKLPEGYALVSKADLEAALDHLDHPADRAVATRLRAVMDSRLTDEEQEAWDAYAAERQATAKPDSREALQALIDATTERVIRNRLADEVLESPLLLCKLGLSCRENAAAFLRGERW